MWWVSPPLVWFGLLQLAAQKCASMRKELLESTSLHADKLQSDTQGSASKESGANWLAIMRINIEYIAYGF